MDHGAKERKALLIFGVAVFACACIGVILRTLSLFFFYDADIGYFSRGALLPTVFNVVIAVAAVCFAVLCFMPKTVFTPDNFGEGKVAELLYVLPCAATVYSLISQIKLLGQYSDLGLTIPRLDMLIFIFTLLALVYFVISILGAKINAGISVIFGIFTMLWLILMLVSLYFDMYIQINSPNKTMMAFAMVSAILFLSGEIRLPLEVKKPKIRLFSAALAVLFLSTSSIPTIVAHLTGAFGSSYAAGPCDVICLALLFPVSARFIRLCFAKEPNVPEDNSEAPLTGSDPE